MSDAHPFSRLELLVGSASLETLARARVILFGVGGVGSWCAEALARSGVGHITVVDSDDVCVTNINRQLQAVPSSVGKSKVDEIARRLRDINPNAEITAIRRVYNRETGDTFELDKYDYVVDAIDSLSSKVDLIVNAASRNVNIFSALGAANKVDPTKIRVSSIWKSDKCKLGRFVRKRLRRRGFNGDFMCVWSDEPNYNVGVVSDNVNDIGDDNVNVNVNDNNIDDNDSNNDNITVNKTINGSLVCVTAVFGFTLASLVIQDIIRKSL